MAHVRPIPHAHHRPQHLRSRRTAPSAAKHTQADGVPLHCSCAVDQRTPNSARGCAALHCTASASARSLCAHLFDCTALGVLPHLAAAHKPDGVAVEDERAQRHARAQRWHEEHDRCSAAATQRLSGKQMKSFGSVLGRARDGDESATAHGGIGAGFRSAAAAQTETAARAFRAGAMQYNAASGADALERPTVAHWTTICC